MIPEISETQERHNDDVTEGDGNHAWSEIRALEI